jgi:hypothetical protein
MTEAQLSHVADAVKQIVVAYRRTQLVENIRA